MNYALSRAESICLQLQQKLDLPDHIKDLINHTKNTADILVESTGNQDNNETIDAEGVSGSSSSMRTTDEDVVELLASTQSVF